VNVSEVSYMEHRRRDKMRPREVRVNDSVEEFFLHTNVLPKSSVR
jgi:hypothetical protein